MATHKNTEMQTLIRELKAASSQNQAPLWKALAEDLERPTRHYPAVNLSKLSRVVAKDELVVVPGKVLGDGEVTTSFTVAALGFSGSAQQKLVASKCTALTIMDLIKKDPKGKRVRVIA